jgi:hypothetical protein
MRRGPAHKTGNHKPIFVKALATEEKEIYLGAKSYYIIRFKYSK